MNTALLAGSSPYRPVVVPDAPILVDKNTVAPNNEESVGYTLGDPVEFTITHLSSTWTAGQNYTLTSAEVKMRRIDAFNYTITAKIYADDGTGYPGTLLGTSTNSIASLSVPDETEALIWEEAQPFSFIFDPLAIRSVTRYHLTIVTGGAYPPDTNSMMVQDNFEGSTGERITVWNLTDPDGFQVLYDCQFYFKTYGVVWVEKDRHVAATEDFIVVGYGSGFKYAGSSWTTGIAYTLRNVRLMLKKAGSPTFNVQVAIYSDSSGPSTVLATSTTTIAAASLTTTSVAIDFFFAGLALSSETKYHIVVYCDAIADSSNYVLIEINYGESTGQATTRDADGVAAFTAQYANTQVIFRTYGYPTPQVLTLTLGTTRNNYTGNVGRKFTCLSRTAVNSLGRYVISGNSASHVVKLVLASTGADISGGSVTINTAGKSPGVVAYEKLAAPIVLDAGVAYYLVSAEVNGGDLFLQNDATVTLHTRFTANEACYNNPSEGTYFRLAGDAGVSYVGVDLLI